jgi:hypothetical protein
MNRFFSPKGDEIMRCRISGLLISLVLLTGCVSPPTSLAQPSPQATINPSITPSRTSTPTESPTPLATPTWFMPTPSSLDATSAFRMLKVPSELIRCEPPCWNELTPGSSPASEIPAFYARLGMTFIMENTSDERLPGMRFAQIDALSPDLGIYQDLNNFYVGVLWSDVVELIQLQYSDVRTLESNLSFLHPSALISSLGRPDSARVGLWADTYYLLHLSFSDKNISVVYFNLATGGTAFTENIEQLKMCFVESELPIIQIFFYSDSFDPNSSLSVALYTDETFTSVEEVTGLNLDELISDLSVPGRCTNLYPYE